VLRDARPLDFRPCIGALGFFKPNYDRRYVEKPPKRQRAVKQEAPKLETMPCLELGHDAPRYHRLRPLHPLLPVDGRPMGHLPGVLERLHAARPRLAGPAGVGLDQG
jgi:hypothetical protein